MKSIIQIEKDREYQRLYKIKNRDKINSQVQAWVKNHPDYYPEYRCQYKYQISFKDKQDMLINQNSECAICRQLLQIDKAFIDHDHKSSKIRGLLCYNCNMGIGHLHDSIVVLEQAIEYLKIYATDTSTTTKDKR